MNPLDTERELIENILSHCFKGLDPKNSKISIHSPDTTGDGYLGMILSVKLNFNNKAYDLVVKVSHQNPEKRKFIQPKPVYSREAYFYTEFYPAIEEYQKQKLGYQLFSSVTRCYGTYFGDNAEALVFKDLKVAGYKLWNRKVPMDENHISMVLEEYGKLHASSLAMRHQEPKRFKELTQCLFGPDVVADIVSNTVGLDVYDKMFTNIVKMLEKEGLEEAAKRTHAFRKEIPDVLLNYADQEDPHSVVLHGDCWCNNMMFLYENQSSKPKKMRFLDFQLSRLGSPLLDVAYYFYSIAPKHALVDTDRYLKIYYKSLAESLQKFECDPDEVFPFDLIKQHWRKYSKFGLVLSAVLFRIALCDKDEAPSVTDSDFSNDLLSSIKNQNDVDLRTINVITHFVDNNLI